MLPRIVIDTNVVLGWLLFQDAACMVIGSAVEAGAVAWIAEPRMRDELAHVLGRGIKGWTSDPAAILACFDRHASPQVNAPVQHRLQCTDPDDQKFLDLALASSASALISRDRAVLRLARRARGLGLSIAEPERWLLDIDKHAERR